MIIAKVVGTVVASQREDGMQGATYLLVEVCDQNLKSKKDFLVALDVVGAGYDELVLISQGSSCRQTETTYQKPVDAMVIAIVDLIDEKDREVYRKYGASDR